MLNIGTDSRCDICLEPFDNGDKNPHAIRCGHMFCAGCIGALAGSPTHVYPMNACPLCRQPFSLVEDVWKLHVDVEPRNGSTGQNSSPNRSGPKPTAEQEEEAQQLRKNFISIATEGADEARTRSVLQSITDFMRPLPREMFWDLRMVARLLAYTCDVRSKNRGLRANLAEKERKLAEAQDEVTDWKKRYEDERVYREEKQKAAEASEKDLKQYILSLSKTYEATVGHYNFVVDEWMKQNEEMKTLRTAFSELRDRSNQPNLRVNPPSPPATRSSFYLSHEDYESRLSGTVMTNPGSLLVSPLPEFTSLPTTLFSCALSPEEEEQAELDPSVEPYIAPIPESTAQTPRRESDLLSLPQPSATDPTTERGVNTRRLNDLLSDNPTPSVTSSSLPVTSSFPPSFDARPRERPRSHSNSHVAVAQPASYSPPYRSRPEPPMATHPPVSTATSDTLIESPQAIRVQPPVYDPTAYTSASAAAQAAEKAKRAKQRAEREPDRARPATPDRDSPTKPGRERQRDRDLSRQDSRRDHNQKTPTTQTHGKYYANGIHPPMLPPRDQPNVQSGYSSVRGTGYSARSQTKLQDVFSNDRHVPNSVPLGVSRG